MNRSPLRDAWKRFTRDRAALVGLALVLAVALAALAAARIAPYDPDVQQIQLRRMAPTLAHVLGTDELGRDILSRMLFGAGATLGAGIFSVLIGVALGAPLGVVAGYHRGIVEGLAMRLVDAMLAFPAFLLAIVVVAILGPTLENAALAIGIAQVPVFARVARGGALVVRGQEYVSAAVATGTRPLAIMVRHIWPNLVPQLIVLAAVSLANAILSIAGLSFIGLGAQPPSSEWGAMLGTGRQYLRDAPHLTVVPGLGIMVLVLAFNLVADGLRDAFDPLMRRSGSV